MKCLGIKFLVLFWSCFLVSAEPDHDRDPPPSVTKSTSDPASVQTPTDDLTSFLKSAPEPADFWRKISEANQDPKQVLGELSTLLGTLTGEDRDRVQKLIEYGRENSGEDEKKSEGPQPDSAKPTPANNGTNTPAPTKPQPPRSIGMQLEDYFKKSPSNSGASPPSKKEMVQRGMRDLEMDFSSTNPEVKALHDRVFDPARVDTINLPNGMSILPPKKGDPDPPEVISTAEFEKQREDALSKVGIEFDRQSGSILYPPEFDLSQLSERELRLTGLDRLSKETQPSALSDGQILLPQGSGKFKIVDGQTYLQSKAPELRTIQDAGLNMQGLLFSGFSEQSNQDASFFPRITQDLKDPQSQLGRSLDNIYPGLREQVLAHAAGQKLFVPEGLVSSSRPGQPLPREAPQDPRLAKVHELGLRAQALEEAMRPTGVGRIVIDPAKREQQLSEHRQVVTEWAREATRLANEGVDPQAYAPTALQAPLGRLATYRQDTAQISPTNYAARETALKSVAWFSEDLADVARVVNPTRTLQTRGAPLVWKDPAQVRLVAPDSAEAAANKNRFLDDVVRPAVAQYNRLYHSISGPMKTNDTTTYSDLEVREFIRNKANSLSTSTKDILEFADAFYGPRWAQNNYWHPTETRKMEATLSRSMALLQTEVSDLGRQAQNDPRLRGFAEAAGEQFKSLDAIKDRPGELAKKYQREVIANGAAAVVTVATMGAGSLMFGVGQAGKAVSLSQLAVASGVGATVATTGHVADIAARRFIDGDSTATLTASSVIKSAGMGAAFGVVGRVAPGLGDLAGAFLGYQGTKASAYAAMDGKLGLAASEAFSTITFMGALKVAGTRSTRGVTGPETPTPGRMIANPFASADNILTREVSLPGGSRGSRGSVSRTESAQPPEPGAERPTPPDLPNGTSFRSDSLEYVREVQRNPEARAAFARNQVEGSTLLIGDLHSNAEIIPALGQFKGKVKKVVVGGDVLDRKEMQGKTNEQLVEAVSGYLDRISEATGVRREDIIFLAGNHDAPTQKVQVPGFNKPDRVIASEVGDPLAQEIRRRGFAVGSSSPEQTVRIGSDIVASHILNNTGSNIDATFRYPRDDLPGGVNDPTLPTGPRVLPSEISIQVNFDTHLAAINGGPHRSNPEKPFISLSVPTAGGVVSTSPGNFRGIALITPSGIPLGYEFKPGRGAGDVGALELREIPTRLSSTVPTNLEDAPGIIPREIQPPTKVSPFESQKARDILSNEGVELTPQIESALTRVHEMFPERGPGQLTYTEKREKFLAGIRALEEAGVQPDTASRLAKTLMRRGVLGNKDLSGLNQSPGMKTLVMEEGYPKLMQQIAEARSNTSGKTLFVDGKKREWIISYDPQSENGYHLNVERFQRNPSAGMNLVNLAAPEAGKKLVDLVVAKNDTVPPAKIRADDTPLYEVHPKHVRGTKAYQEHKDAGVLPNDHVELYRRAVRDDRGDYWAIDQQGNLHRFQTTNWQAHWNGATQAKKPGKDNTSKPSLDNPKPIEWGQVPDEILLVYPTLRKGKWYGERK